MLTRTNFIGLRGRVSDLLTTFYIHGWEMDYSISFLFFLKNNYYFVKKLAESLHISFFCCIFVVEIRTTTKTLTTMATTIKNATLYNDYDYNVEDYRDAYIDHCDDLGINVEDEIPMDFIRDMLDADWFALFDNLDSNIYNDECVVIGSLGLWNGRKDINPTREDTLAEAIMHCCHNCDYSRIKIVDGHVEVTSAHHDGTNHFEIHLLNKRGRNTLGADLTKSCYHRKIKDDFWG